MGQYTLSVVSNGELTEKGQNTLSVVRNGKNGEE